LFPSFSLLVTNARRTVPPSNTARIVKLITSGAGLSSDIIRQTVKGQVGENRHVGYDNVAGSPPALSRARKDNLFVTLFTVRVLN
jgi:hypothetical protein